MFSGHVSGLLILLSDANIFTVVLCIWKVSLYWTKLYTNFQKYIFLNNQNIWIYKDIVKLDIYFSTTRVEKNKVFFSIRVIKTYIPMKKYFIFHSKFWLIRLKDINSENIN